MKPPAQIDLFARKPRSFDEAALVRRLREAALDAERAAASFTAFGRASAQAKYLMRPLPPITVPR